MNRRLAGYGVLAIAAVMAIHGTCWAEPRMGRLGLLCDVHGYETGDRVLVPLRGVAEWFGAQPDQQPKASGPPGVGDSATGRRRQWTKSSLSAWPQRMLSM